MKICISVPDDVAARIDEIAASSGKSRSWVYTTAALQFAARLSELKAGLDKIYGSPVSRPPTAIRRIIARDIHKARGGHAW